MGRPGSGALPPLTARPLGGLLGPLWGVRGRTLSRPRLPALRAGCRGRCGASGVGRSPTPDCSPSRRAAGAGVGRPGSDALPPPTARPLGGLPEPVWGVRGRALSHPRLPALWAGCQGRCGVSGVGRSPTPGSSPSGWAAGASVGRLGSDALPPPTARPSSGLPGPVWGVRGPALSHPRLLALWAGCRGLCGASGVARSPTPACPPSGRAAGAGVGRPGSGALPPLTARPLGGLPGPVWGVRGQTLSHPRQLALWAGCGGRCGASGVGRSPTPDCPPSGRAAGAGVARPGSGALPPPTARPLGGLPGPVWGVRGRTLSHPRLPALWAGCPGRCWASGVGRSPTPNCPPFRAGCRAAVRVRALLGRVGQAGLWGAFWCASPFLWPFLLRYLLVRPPPGWGCPGCGCCWVFFASCPTPPSVHPVVFCFACFPAWGAPGLGVLLSPPPPFFFIFFLFFPPPLPFVSGVSCFPVAFGLCAPPLFFSFFLSCCFFSCCVFALCVLGCRAVCSLSCPFVVLCASSVLFLVAGVVGSWCRCLLLGVCWWLWLPGVVVWWCVSALVPVSGLAVAGRPPCGVLCPCAVSCGAVRPRGAVLGALSSFFFFFGFLFLSLLVTLVSCCSPVVLASGPVLGRFCFCALPVRCCAGVPAPLLSVRCSLALAGLAGVLCCCLLCSCVCCWAPLSSVVSWWVLVAPGVVSRWRAVVCPWVLCCAVLLRVVPLGVALLCTVLFRFAQFGAAARRAVSWGAVLCLGVLCLLAPCFVLSPRAVCVLLWCVAAWCCSPLCSVPCAP